MNLSLSVISPAYNGEKCINGFLESIASQTYDDFEFVIIDDASTDQTADIIDDYLSRMKTKVQFIRHEKNMGEKATISEAFSRVGGDICIKMDADSLFKPETFAKIMESFVANPQVGLVTVPEAAIDHSNWILRGDEVTLVARHRSNVRDTQGYESASGRCLAFRRQIFSTSELASRIDVDLAWLARERGWKILLREDITIQTRLPDSLTWTFTRGRRIAKEVLSTYWNHKNKLLTRWGFWVKFAPLVMLIVSFFRPRWGILSVLGWFGVTQVFLAFRAPEYPLRDRIAAWFVTVIRWSGFNLETVIIAGGALIGFLEPRKR